MFVRKVAEFSYYGQIKVINGTFFSYIHLAKKYPSQWENTSVAINKILPTFLSLYKKVPEFHSINL